jgi:hypothetical protein
MFNTTVRPDNRESACLSFNTFLLVNVYQNTSTHTIEAVAELGPPTVWKTLVLTIVAGERYNFISRRVVSAVLHKSSQITTEEGTIWVAKVMGQQMDVQGTIDISFCARGSTEAHDIPCYITKEWDPRFDIVMAKGSLPKSLKRSLKGA